MAKVLQSLYAGIELRTRGGKWLGHLANQLFELNEKVWGVVSHGS
jgi:hypothetical protein